MNGGVLNDMESLSSPESPTLPSKVQMFAIAGVALLAGVFVFYVVRPFLLPILLACFLSILLWPFHLRLERHFRGHSRLAAAFSTLVLLTLLFLPLGFAFTLASAQLADLAATLSDRLDIDEAITAIDSPVEESDLPSFWLQIRSHLSREEIQRFQRAIERGIVDALETISQRTLTLVDNLLSVLIGTVVTILSVYYFLADHGRFADSIRELSPLDDSDNRKLWDKFTEVSRGVLLGNIFSAAAQSMLTGLGLAVLGVPKAWLLGLLAFFVSFVPFLGAAAVWLSVVVVLLFEQRFVAAIILLIYGSVIISSADNLIRAFALKGSARIHPLIALISILGAMRLVGLWGLIVGPVSVAFLYALLQMLKEKLDEQTTPRTAERAN